MSDKPAGGTSLAAMLLEAQRAVQNVPKDARNEFSGYDYTSAESIITEARRALHAAGLTVYRREWVLSMLGESPIVIATFVVASPTAELEAACPFPIVETKGKPLDKALATALTSGLAYWLRDLLLIPRCAEEMDKRDDAGHEPEKQGRGTPTEARPTAETPVPTSPPSTAGEQQPRTLAQLGQLLLTMAGGDKAAASKLCNDLLGVPTLREFRGYLPDAIDKVWGEYKDRGYDVTQ